MAAAQFSLNICAPFILQASLQGLFIFDRIIENSGYFPVTTENLAVHAQSGHMFFKQARNFAIHQFHHVIGIIFAEIFVIFYIGLYQKGPEFSLLKMVPVFSFKASIFWGIRAYSKSIHRVSLTRA